MSQRYNFMPKAYPLQKIKVKRLECFIKELSSFIVTFQPLAALFFRK